MALNNESKSTASTTTTTIDTTVNNNVTITIQWGNALAGNTLTATQGFTKFIG